MIHWRTYRPLLGKPVWEGLVARQRAFLIRPAKAGQFELHTALPPGAPVRTFTGVETAKAAARRILRERTKANG